MVGHNRDEWRLFLVTAGRAGAVDDDMATRAMEVFGPGPVDGLFYATGHHRNGILLVPITAEAIARLVRDGDTEAAIRPFGIERFARAEAAE